MKTPLRDVNGIDVKRTPSKINSVQPITVNKPETIAKNMVHSEKNALSKGMKNKAVEKIIATEKENSAPILRRSKRAAVTESFTKLEPAEESKVNKPSVKNVKVKKTPAKRFKAKNESKTGRIVKSNLSQTKLDFHLVETEDVVSIDKIPEDVCKLESEKDTATTVTEDSGFGNIASRENSPNYSIAVFNSPDIRSTVGTPCTIENSILSTASPPASYWKDLAEQRRQALEKALYENELLHDQLEVLEAENYQLKQMIKEAEDLAEAVKGIIE